ncbi:MAG: ABC transporter ATP-binding protein [Desulfosudaceae bacterium]
MSAKNVISVQHISKRYGKYVVLDDVNFGVHRGEILVILGASGCGKSTLMRIMTGLERASAGRVFIEDEHIAQCNTTRKTGILFQNNALFGSMTVAENIALPIAEYTTLDERSIRKIVAMKLAMVGLSGFEGHLPSEISGGLKKKAALARALALNPAILFLDEPSTGLDPISSAEIDELILNINRNAGTTMIVVTHELDSVFAIADRVIMLDQSTRGKIAEGTPQYLKNECPHPFVRQFFNRQPHKRSAAPAAMAH